jgi:hypothetical protein
MPKKEKASTIQLSQGNRFWPEVGDQHVDRNPKKDKHQHSPINHSTLVRGILVYHISLWTENLQSTSKNIHM